SSGVSILVSISSPRFAGGLLVACPDAVHARGGLTRVRLPGECQFWRIDTKLTRSAELARRGKHKGRRNSVSRQPLCRAGDLGFEPRLTDPESVVLPLHQSPMSLGVCHLPTSAVF